MVDLPNLTLANLAGTARCFENNVKMSFLGHSTVSTVSTVSTGLKSPRARLGMYSCASWETFLFCGERTTAQRWSTESWHSLGKTRHHRVNKKAQQGKPLGRDFMLLSLRIWQVEDGHPTPRAGEHRLRALKKAHKALYEAFARIGSRHMTAKSRTWIYTCPHGRMA